MPEHELQLISKYPFLSEAKEYVASLGMSIRDMENHPIYKSSFELGRKRAADALEGELNVQREEKIEQELAVLSFVIARILVNLTDNESIMRRYARSEARYAHWFLKKDSEENVERVKKDLGVEFTEENGTGIDFSQYLQLAKDLVKRDSKWKLINRRMQEGQVQLQKAEKLILIREAIREEIMQPIKIPGIPEKFQDMAQSLENEFTETVEEISIDELDMDTLPPCIHKIIGQLEQGSINHHGMFVLATCLLGTGLGVDDVLKIFSRYPDYNEKKSRYQIEFLAGKRGGTSYSCPTCSRIESYGLCVQDCGIKHPLMYFRDQKKKKEREKEEG